MSETAHHAYFAPFGPSLYKTSTGDCFGNISTKDKLVMDNLSRQELLKYTIPTSGPQSTIPKDGVTECTFPLAHLTGILSHPGGGCFPNSSHVETVCSASCFFSSLFPLRV